MATIATDVQWGNSPKVYFDFSCLKQRNGTTQQYKITVKCKSLESPSYFGYPIYLEITANGTVAATKTLKNSSPSQWSSALSYTTDWISVANKTTGTTPIKIRIYSGSGNSRNTTYSYSLDIDPAASLVGATDANIESTSTVTFTRYNSNFTHTLAYMADGQSSYTSIFTKQDITQYAWTVPSALYSLIPNDTEIEVTLRCQTYSGSTLMGTTYCTMTATTAKSKCAPAVNIAAVDSNENTIALTGSNKKIIKYHSDIAVTATVTAKNSASISETTLKCGPDTFSGALTTFTDAESVSISATATDSRGYATTTAAADLTLINYVKLTANTTLKRTSAASNEVTISTKGNYFNGSFGAASNTLKVQAAYKLPSETSYSSYQDMTVTINGNTYTATITLTGLVYTENYDIRVRAQDQIYKYGGALATAVYTNQVLQKGIPVFDWGENDFQFNVPVNLLSNKYFFDGEPGIDAKNSDIANLNGLYFNDTCNDRGKGILFYTNDGTYDRVYVLNGVLYIAPNEELGVKETGYVVFDPSNKPYYEAGDVALINAPYAGVVTSGRTEFIFLIPLSKPILANSFALNGTVNGRGVSGYVLDSYNNPINLAGGTGYSVETSKVIGGIKVKIVYANEQTTGVSNNTPINWYGSVTITFS